MSRILVFDAQVLQTPAWHRGMGKYSLELIVALHNLNEVLNYWNNIQIVFSKKLNLENSVTEALQKRAPSVTVSYLNLSPNEYDNRPVAQGNRKYIDDLLNSLIRQNEADTADYIVLSLMQSEVAPAFSSLKNVHNYLLFYDLIPLMFYKTYLREPLNQKSYLSKLSELLKADTYLTISKTVANDMAAVLGIHPQRIVSIDGAPIEHGAKAHKYEVPVPFVLMPTGNDLRKNNRRGIEGFQAFNQRHNNKYTLVVTSTFEDFEIVEYKSICPNIVFTGNIKGEELEYLYQTTEALLFPTEYEGLGLPILEALEKNKPVACSDISVFREMSDKAFFYFDARDPADIGRALTDAIGTKKLPIGEYRRVINKYKWERTAEIFYNTAQKYHFTKEGSSGEELVIFSATPEESSYSTEIQALYSELHRLRDVVYYIDQRGTVKPKSINYLPHLTKVVNIAQPSHIDLPTKSLPIYFIENDACCASVLLIALANPGIVVLKDRNLEKLWIAAKERGLIDQTRFTAENIINEKYNDTNFLVSLLAGQKIVLSSHQQILKCIEELVAKLPIHLRPTVNHIPAWQTALVFKELSLDASVVDYPINTTLGYNFSIYDYARELYRLATDEQEVG